MRAVSRLGLLRRVSAHWAPVHLSCEEAREGLSARIDREAVHVTEAALHAHMRSCPGCREFEVSSIALNARVSLRVTRSAPHDLLETLTSSAQSDLKDQSARPDTPSIEPRVLSARSPRAKFAAVIAPAAIAVTALPLGLSVHSDVTPTHVRTPCTIWLRHR